MELLREFGFEAVNHYVPLHYLPFVARTGQLLSKPELRARGFLENHFRSKSKDHDDSRGFGGYVHLTTHPCPPILQAKLAGGFPHIRLQIPTAAVDVGTFDLCRFNVAMTRQLRRGQKSGHAESSVNGRYYGALQIPLARTVEDKRAMLDFARQTGAMIEVLVPAVFQLPVSTQVHCYSAPDAWLAQNVLNICGRRWAVFEDEETYAADPHHSESVRTFIGKALQDPDWKGDGLEFDKV